MAPPAVEWDAGKGLFPIVGHSLESFAIGIADDDGFRVERGKDAAEAGEIAGEKFRRACWLSGRPNLYLLICGDDAGGGLLLDSIFRVGIRRRGAIEIRSEADEILPFGGVAETRGERCGGQSGASAEAGENCGDRFSAVGRDQNFSRMETQRGKRPSSSMKALGAAPAGFHVAPSCRVVFGCAMTVARAA